MGGLVVAVVIAVDFLAVATVIAVVAVDILVVAIVFAHVTVMNIQVFATAVADVAVVADTLVVVSTVSLVNVVNILVVATAVAVIQRTIFSEVIHNCNYNRINLCAAKRQFSPRCDGQMARHFNLYSQLFRFQLPRCGFF